MAFGDLPAVVVAEGEPPGAELGELRRGLPGYMGGGRSVAGQVAWFEREVGQLGQTMRVRSSDPTTCVDATAAAGHDSPDHPELVRVFWTLLRKTASLEVAQRRSDNAVFEDVQRYRQRLSDQVAAVEA